MKNFGFRLLLVFSLVSISSSPVMSASWDSGNIGNTIVIEEQGFFDPLIDIYNKLIELTKNTIEKNMDKVVRSANALLSAMATVYIVVMGARSFITGSQFLSSVVEKMFLFLALSALLQFSWYDKYILKNIENLFNNLPTLFNSGGGNVIANLINQTSSLASDIWKAVGEVSWLLKGMAMFIAIVAMVTLASLTLVVLVNILILTVEFYFVLSLSSIFLLLFFFKFTRSLSMGAVQIVFGAILKVTLLSFFLNLYGGLIQASLVFDGAAEFFSACMGVILISVVGIVLIKIVNEIANRITGGVGQMAGTSIPHLGNLAKNLIGK